MRYNVIGTMSGTSLDGLDIAYCSFTFSDNKWKYKIIAAQTVKYPQGLVSKLKNAKHLSGQELMLLDKEFAYFVSLSINDFIFDHSIEKTKINCISSHGHTVFHQPEIRLTTQIGHGANISAYTNLPVISDFRTMDLALGGQGAPLVPIGDQLLFSEYDYCINLGGISNISYQEDNRMSDNYGKRIAFDICPVNIVLNKLANKKGLYYDINGELAKKGQINYPLLEKFNQLPYYQKEPPKSLGLEWIEKNIYPILNSSNISVEDKLRTFNTHIAQQIRKYLYNSDKKVLITGGGAHNSFLIENIRLGTTPEIIISNKKMTDFKEALIFAFLGVLRLRKEVNCLKSVTGASKDNIGGCIYQSF